MFSRLLQRIPFEAAKTKKTLALTAASLAYTGTLGTWMYYNTDVFKDPSKNKVEDASLFGVVVGAPVSEEILFRLPVVSSKAWMPLIAPLRLAGTSMFYQEPTERAKPIRVEIENVGSVEIGTAEEELKTIQKSVCSSEYKETLRLFNTSSQVLMAGYAGATLLRRLPMAAAASRFLYPIAVADTCIDFGLVHLLNSEKIGRNELISVSAFQLPSGCVLFYIARTCGLRYSILAHAIENGVLVGVGHLLDKYVE